MSKIINLLLAFIDKIPLWPLVAVAGFMSLAPFSPEPHLLEKSRMLVNGELTKGIDIFDLFWHALFPILLLLRLISYKKSAPNA